MRLIVGLGNPGNRYRDTPHNAGYQVADLLAARFRLKWRQTRKIDAEFADGPMAGVDCLLLKPTTYMNASGEAVLPLVRGENLDVARDLLVVYDDVALPLGRIRIRASGSSGGHRGMNSIISALRTNEFPRLRCGVSLEEDAAAPVPGHGLKDYVLTPWPRSCRPPVEEMVALAADAVEMWLTHEVGDVMTEYNRK
ncbi:aminoacyl-tRNA hydrolase [bacterium]|nr:aminoacyl-tRNA hydrolase [bacterium]